MIKIMGKEYISDKEAEHIYGFSRDWFKKRRSLKNGGPPFIKLEGKVLYQTKELDAWFKSHMKASGDE